MYVLFLLSFSRTLTELAALTGYDYVVVDMEHGSGGIPKALACLRALDAARTPVVLRLPEASAVWAKKALDLGPAGLMLPATESPEAAAEAVSHCRSAATRRAGSAALHTPSSAPWRRGSGDVGALLIPHEVCPIQGAPRGEARQGRGYMEGVYGIVQRERWLSLAFNKFDNTSDTLSAGDGSGVPPRTVPKTCKHVKDLGALQQQHKWDNTS
ncbi:aldolase like [Zea mays]|uniref:Aldolase like n=1 Tax=Zea mays TaxID=4577 RepID=A0A1D6N2B9_MAIZE|nr:aldolase like [Zea mays]